MRRLAGQDQQGTLDVAGRRGLTRGLLRDVFNARHLIGSRAVADPEGCFIS
jgi:hypothetical protein